MEYGPGYQLEVCPAHYTNYNTVEYMETVAKAITSKSTILRNLGKTYKKERKRQGR